MLFIFLVPFDWSLLFLKRNSSFAGSLETRTEILSVLVTFMFFEAVQRTEPDRALRTLIFGDLFLRRGRRLTDLALFHYLYYIHIENSVTKNKLFILAFYE